MADKEPHLYGFDAAPRGLPFAQVDDELRRAEAYFTRLRDELGDSFAATVAGNMVETIQILRFELKRSQEHQEQGREIQRRLYGPRPPSGSPEPSDQT